MFFGLSKLFWTLVQPLNLLCLVGMAGLVMRLFTERAGEVITTTALLLIVLLGVLPIGPIMLSWIESRYPTPHAVPDNLDGVIVLGGAFETHLSQETGQVVANDNIERMFCFMELAHANPTARIAFSGGPGDIVHPDAMEGNDVRAFFDLVRFDRRNDVVYEEKSRNTYENALYSRELLAPKQGERWALVTSAFHMPRSVGIFEKLGWPVIPYACDPKTAGADTVWKRLPNVAGNYAQLNIAMKEMIGSLVYYVTGKSAFIVPPGTLRSAP